MRLEDFVCSSTSRHHVFSCSLRLLLVARLRATRRGGASVPPGATAQTLMFCSAYSNARDAVSAFTPPLAAAYGARLMPRVAIEETLTIVPLLCFSMTGSTARQHHIVGNSERRISASAADARRVLSGC